MLIGAFDSGLGGLLLIKTLSRRFPQEQFVYFVDAHHFPYGEKSTNTLCSIVNKNIQFLMQQKVDLIVVTCNTASSVLETKNYSTPVMGIIESTLKQADACSKNKCLGLLATEATVRSNAYLKTAEQFGLSLDIHQQACPLLAPIIQKGDADREEIVMPVLEKYLNPLLQQKVDTIIMGCTHYFYVEKWIQKLVGRQIKVVRPVDFLIQHIAQLKQLISAEPKAIVNKDCTISIYINVDEPRYKEQCLKIIENANIQFLS